MPDVPPRFARPEDLLIHLGLTNPAEEERSHGKDFPSEGARAEIAGAGYDWEAACDRAEDPMAAELMDILFVTESVAREVLNTNFARLVDSMHALTGGPGIPRATAFCAAELGGGGGLLAMWLLVCYPLCRGRVYDHSRNALAVGERWADRLGLRDRLTFHHASYADLASASTGAGDCDLVFLDRAMAFYCHVGSWLGTNGPAEVGATVHAGFKGRYRDLLGAVRHLLAPGGTVLMATGPAPPLALETFCGELRRAGFHLVWDLFRVEDGPNLCLKAGNTHLLTRAADDALAIHSSAMEEREGILWTEGECLRQLFSPGQLLVEIRRRCRGIPVEWEVTLQQRAGLVLAIKRSTAGEYIASLHSAALTPELARGCLRFIDQVADGKTTRRRIATGLRKVLAQPAPSRYGTRGNHGEAWGVTG